MPEQMKQCPICGDTNPIVNADSGHVICCKIVVDDVAVWNSLPRALRWTHEPPTVAGWYWVRRVGDNDYPIVKHVTQRDADEGFAVLSNREWAGPIQEPGESGHE